MAWPRGLYDPRMKDWLRRLHPFHTPEARRLAVLFAVVYFAQGMYGLPDQAIAIGFKDQGLTADRVANFFLLASIPWFIKPLYGLISDFLPLFGRRRKSYLLLTSALACAAGSDCRAVGAARLLVACPPLHGDGPGPGLQRCADRRADGGEGQAARADGSVSIGAMGGGHLRFDPGGVAGGALRRTSRPARCVHRRRRVPPHGAAHGGVLRARGSVPAKRARSSCRPGQRCARGWENARCGWWRASSSCSTSAPRSVRRSCTTRPTCSASASSTSASSLRSARPPASPAHSSTHRCRG